MARFQKQVVFVLALLTVACGEAAPTEPRDGAAPRIQVGGVDDGGTHASPVTVEITVDRGTFQATLNGVGYTSGTPITEAGEYTLTVVAQSSRKQSTRTIRFTVVPGGGGGGGGAGGVVVIRLMNLGDNGSGGGDAILIIDSAGGRARYGMVDAGPGGSGGSVTNEALVLSRLKALGIDTLQFLLLSHAHFDHYAGMDEILRDPAVHVKRFIYNGQVRPSASTYTRVVSEAQTHAGMVIRQPQVPDSAISGFVAADFIVLPPLPTYLGTDPDKLEQEGQRLNDGSLGALLRHGSFEMFFTGDSQVEANRRWMQQFPTYSRDVTVLKVGHHGANNAIFDNGFSGTSSWLQHTNPAVAVISSNGRTHPRVAALNALLTRSAMRTYCTSVHGDITIRVAASGEYTVTPERRAGDVCVPGTDANT